MRLTITMFALLLAAQPMSAQQIGDSLRVRLRTSAQLQYGRFLGTDSAALRLRQFPTDRAYRLSDIEKVDVWTRRNPGTAIFLSAAAVAAGWATGMALSKDSRPITGSKGGDIAAAAGVGALLGVISISVTPGNWRRLRL